MKRITKKAVILTADKFEDMELFFPLFRLIEAGWKVDVAAPKVVDGNLVTSRWLMDLPAFMREVMEMVEKINN